MEDQTSWKGHSFTLLVFGGIVVLCSIFFVLGMLVGRTQGQKLAEVEAAEVSARAETRPVEAEKPVFDFYHDLETTHPSLEEPINARPAPAPRAPAKAAEPAQPARITTFQIVALRKSEDAEKVMTELKGKGFPAFILAPPPDDANPFFRVQVGPFHVEQEAELTKRRLETAGYKPIVRR